MRVIGRLAVSLAVLAAIGLGAALAGGRGNRSRLGILRPSEAADIRGGTSCFSYCKFQFPACSLLYPATVCTGGTIGDWCHGNCAENYSQGACTFTLNPFSSCDSLPDLSCGLAYDGFCYGDFTCHFDGDDDTSLCGPVTQCY
jgi:hypothetical protein